MAKFRISPKQVAMLNEHLKDLEDIKDDFEAAKQVGTPNMDEMIEVCNTCKDRIIKVKELWAKGSK